MRIGSDVWVGCGCRILAGCSIENRTVIAANAVVKGVLPSGGIWAGAPARLVKSIEL